MKVLGEQNLIRIQKGLYFRSFINVYKGPNMQTMDEKADLVQKLLGWLYGEIQQEREWQNTPDANLQEVQGRFHF